MNLNGSIFLNASGNGAMRGTVSMIASESAKLRTSSALKLSALQGSVLDVQSAGPMTLTGGFSAGSSGYSLLRAPGVEIAGPVSLGAYATVNVVADGEMRLTGSSASLGLDAHLKLWSENLAIDTTNRIGYTYRVYGATYGVTNNPSNRGIGWFYGVTSPYAAWAPPGAAAPEGVTLSSATYVRPLHPLLFGPFIPSIAPRMPLFRQAGAEFFPSEPAEPLSPRDEEQEEPSQPARPAVSSLR